MINFRRPIKSNAVPFILLAAGAALLMASTASAMRYTGCVQPAGCTGYPPPGASCLVIFQDDGTTAANNGLGAEAEWCAYVTTQGPTWGWPCGGAFPCETGC